ncbi:hypothetical protein B0T22DRAFT_436995 [Podospora appendiculata]|uniref:Uncharacterized protein n=1 Tax=Podospora appendiculata TaxID=314037 RepID=A0AAE1CGV6_9PEZI|nr:hypothetical protein B0T22DRAFT_436995 [Podospora appendiculata]
MGNLCGKQSSSSSSDPFARPGRRLGSAPAPRSSAPIPAAASTPRPVVVGSGSGSGNAADDQRRKAAAAAAAEQRTKRANTVGKLGSQLAAQKKQTHLETLKEASSAKLRQREVDANADTLNYN